MEKIIFDEKTFIYKTKLDLSKFKDEILAECEAIIKLDTTGHADHSVGYDIDLIIDDFGKIDIQNRFGEIAQIGIDCCLELLQTRNIIYSKIFNYNWINVSTPKHSRFDPSRPSKYDYPELLTYHSHNTTTYLYEGEVFNNRPIPEYTFVYYIQMPDNLNDDDGVLSIKGADGKKYSILPEEGDLLVFSAGLLHSPYPAFNSSKDRIIFGGDVGFLV